jgi:class 3 adenylate cyclase
VRRKQAIGTWAGSNGRPNLDRLLRDIIDKPDDQDQIAGELDRQLGETAAVMILDMTGFARTTRSYGIVAFLLMIYQMKLLATPCIEAENGVVVKSDADNLYCLFPDVASAIRASQAIIARLAAEAERLPSDRRLYASIGIGFGRILNLAATDIFGDEVNLASKLGEDVARQGEILLTSDARAQAPEWPVREESVTISGVSMTYFALL